MDWKNFFQLNVMKNQSGALRPYFQTYLKVPELFSLEELNVSNFEEWNLTEDEKKRFGLMLRKIVHCHHYFNSLEFGRITENFIQRLLSEKENDLSFVVNGGAIQLFLAAIRDQHSGLIGKKILCETTEFPIPIIKLPVDNKLQILFLYRPHSTSFFASFPSLWARPEILKFFDAKTLNKVA